MPKATPHLIDHGILDRVAERARDLGQRAVAVFDLDSTLLDNRRRQARILAEFGHARALEPLKAARAEHWQDWSIRRAMANCGLDAATIERVHAEARGFWRERFFTSEYCVDDIPIAGAPQYVREIAEAFAQVVYCTGRHEAMRPGTVASLATHGFPVPERDPGVALLMKPTFDSSDDGWKERAREQIATLGDVIAAFDNEPTHINLYRAAFPNAASVHLATDDSGRPVPLAAGIVSIRDFTRGTRPG